MRGLSLTQPWATLAAIGAKKVETRSWRTPYRGLVAIHSSAEYPPWARQSMRLEPFARALAGVRGELPLGKILAVVDLTHVYPITDGFAAALEPDEHAFGNYEPGRYAFRLASPRPLAIPIPYKGRLGLWPIPPETEVRIRAAAGMVV